FLLPRPPPTPTLFPYTTLFRSRTANRGPPELFSARGVRRALARGGGDGRRRRRRSVRLRSKPPVAPCEQRTAGRDDEDRRDDQEDRKSTRLNSSHLVISYAVFC